MPTLDENLKNWLQAIAWIAASIGVVITVIRFWSELRLGRIQRESDHRWKQAQAGKSLNDEMLTDPLAWPALQMLDSDGRVFKLPSGEAVAICLADVRNALDPNSVDEKMEFIRDCFDSLFYYLAMMEHYTNRTLVNAEDVAYPLDYYVPLLNTMRPQVDAYLNKYELRRAINYLARFETWK
jgi:hypothetical protein